MVQVSLEEKLCRCLFFSAHYKEIVESLVQIFAIFLGQMNPIFAELIVVTKVSVANVKIEYKFGFFSIF